MIEKRDEYEFHMEEAKFLMPSPAIIPQEKGVHMNTSALHHYLQGGGIENRQTDQVLVSWFMLASMFDQIDPIWV